jgi:uncharacterized protein
MGRFIRILVFALSALSATQSPSQTFQVTVERNVPVRMRDGVVLRADIYRPKSDLRLPVLLQRTPYDKLNTCDMAYAAAAHGYVVVVQDTRGRYASDGDFYPFRYEAQDGYDTVEWAAQLSYSNGKVGMFGASYIGVTQMQAAAAAPPHLAGIFPVVTASDYHDGWTYAGGAYEQWFNQTWGSGLVQDTLNRLVKARTVTANDVMKLPLSAYPEIDTGLPARFGPSALGSYYRDWLEHPSFDDYWRAFSVEEHYQQINVPAYHVGGVYDIFLRGTLRNYLGIHSQAPSPAVRQGQRLEIMMASHNRGGPRVGDRDFGPNATFDELSTLLEWYDYILKGADNGLSNQKPVKIFVMGSNKWRYEDEWPPSGSRTVRYYLHSSGGANSLSGEGGMSETPPAAEAADTFLYDPGDPARTLGGALCCDETDLPGGPFDQSKVESRKDVLVYTTAPFDRELDLIGPVSVELFASSSAVDTDFTGKLVDVWPDGYAQNLTDGIIRARYRDSQAVPNLMKPGTIYKFVVDLVSVSDALLPSHRLRIEISSSNFPRFDRNLNSADGTLTVAKNSVYHDHVHPSAVLFTLAPLKSDSTTGSNANLISK